MAEQQSKNEQEKEQGILGDYENKIGTYIDSSRDTVTISKEEYEQLKNRTYIVDSYHDNTTWYRVWSDGWIEQGGISTSGDNATGLATVFKKSFTNNNYTITTSDVIRKRVNAAAFSVVITQKNATEFYVSSSYCLSSGMQYCTATFSWYACGY